MQRLLHRVEKRRVEKRRVEKHRVEKSVAIVVATVTLSLGVLLALEPASAKSGGWPEARANFKLALANNDPDQILDALAGLGRFETAESTNLVINHGLMHEDIIVHKECFDFLARLKADDAQEAVIKAARKAKRWEVRSQCARVLATFRGNHTRLVLEEIMEKDKAWNVRSSAVKALAHQRHKSSVSPLVARLKAEKVRRVRWDVVSALRDLTGLDFEDEHKQWYSWWAVKGDDFELPTLADIQAQRDKENEPKALETAVAEGLYGPIYSERVVFIFDISGSMSVGTEMKGTRLDIAKRELSRALENISEKSYFNIVAFSDKAHLYKKQMIRSKPKSLKSAIKWVESLRPGGETNAYAALETAFDDEDMDTIYFLTDGSPTVGEKDSPVEIRRAIEDWNRHRAAIVHCIGFFPGDAMNEEKKDASTFLRKLAHENDGFYKEIY